MSLFAYLALPFAIFLADKPSPPPEDKEQAPIVELFRSKQLFGKSDYPAIRKVFADVIFAEHEQTIKDSLGTDYESFIKWLESDPELREEFLVALNAEYDKPGEAFSILRDLHKKYGDKVSEFREIAIAVAVTWDAPDKLQHYNWFVDHTKSKANETTAGAVENFGYVINDLESLKELANLPWEMAIFLVDHRTPLAERTWAASEYGQKRKMFGGCYKDVPYDYDWLRRDQPHLAGKEYSLSNIREHGGICEVQADFASRVGKSIGVPAMWVRGDGRWGGIGHAWVMWVEIKSIGKGTIVGSFESFGRYDIDKYYTGIIKHPQTGQEVIDRMLEIELGNVARKITSKRQADLAMRAYPAIAKAESFELPDRLRYLDATIKLCELNQQSWLELARLVKDKVIDRSQGKLIKSQLSKVLSTFEDYPDFCWLVFEDLISLQDNLKQKTGHYIKIIDLFEKAQRPDLVCQARLRLSTLQAGEEKWDEAAEGLASTILRYPDEGRLVPDMLKLLDECCKHVKNGSQLLASFYLSLLPKIPTHRGDDVSTYCVDTHEHAAKVLREFNETAAADRVETMRKQIGSRKDT